MVERSAHLVDRVLPFVPVRQWVLSLPFSGGATPGATFADRSADSGDAASADPPTFVRIPE